MSYGNCMRFSWMGWTYISSMWNQYWNLDWSRSYYVFSFLFNTFVLYKSACFDNLLLSCKSDGSLPSCHVGIEDYFNSIIMDGLLQSPESRQYCQKATYSKVLDCIHVRTLGSWEVLLFILKSSFNGVSQASLRYFSNLFLYCTSLDLGMDAAVKTYSF